MKPIMNEPIPELKTLIWRGWHKKCPHCGKGDLYQRWLRLYEHCPACGLLYLSSQGDLLGSLIFLDRVLFIIPLIVFFYFGLWNPNLPMLLLSGVTVMLLLIFTMPNRNGVSLAIDYLLRRKQGDLADPSHPTKL